MICVNCRKEFKTPGELKEHRGFCILGKPEPKKPTVGTGAIDSTAKVPKKNSKKEEKKEFPGIKKDKEVKADNIEDKSTDESKEKPAKTSKKTSKKD
jgi:hypothetical protein